MPSTIPVLVTSPTPLPLQRTMLFGENVTFYDTGQSQGQTAWTRELWKWKVGIKNQQTAFINSLTAFVRGRLGRTRPFFFSDPYDFWVNSQLLQNTGTAIATFELMHPVGSYHVYPNSAVLTLTSNLSGALSNGIDYSLDHDTGYIGLLITARSNDFIRVTSTQFFRKVRFDSDYGDQSRLWTNFDGEISFTEIP